MTNQEINKIHKEGYFLEQERIRKQALKELFKRDGIDYDLMNFKFHKRCFLWIKTLFCLLLKRTGASYLDSNSFCVLSFNEGGDVFGQHWDAVWISSDLFKGWRVCLGSDGT